MMNWMNRTYLGAKIKLSDLMNEMREEEAGVSSLVATVLLILMVVVLAALFWEQISGWFVETMEKIFKTGEPIGDL